MGLVKSKLMTIYSKHKRKKMNEEEMPTAFISTTCRLQAAGQAARARIKSAATQTGTHQVTCTFIIIIIIGKAFDCEHSPCSQEHYKMQATDSWTLNATVICEENKCDQ